MAPDAHMVDTLETVSAFGMRVRPRVTQDADLSAAIDFDPRGANMDRISIPGCR